MHIPVRNKDSVLTEHAAKSSTIFVSRENQEEPL